MAVRHESNENKSMRDFCGLHSFYIVRKGVSWRKLNYNYDYEFPT